MTTTIARSQIHKSYIDLDQNEARNLRLQQLGTDIASPVDGLIFYRTDTDKVRVYINGSWEDLATMDDLTAGGLTSALFDLKGDLLVGTGSDTVSRKAAGANGTLLVADSTQSDGLIWRVLADGDIPSAIARDAEVTSAISTHAALAVLDGDTAGGVLAGTYPSPSFAADMATQAELDAHTGQVTGAHAASAISFSPAANIAATTVQAALVEVVSDLTASITSVTESKIWKDPVRIVTLSNDTLSGLAARDGITPVAGDRVLVAAQTAGAANGIYVAAAGAWARSADADIAAELTNATTLVTAGTVSSGDTYTQTATITTLGTTVQTWVKSGEGNTVYTADGSTIVLTGTQFGVPASGITATQIAAAVAGNGLSGGAGTALAVATGTGLEISSDTVRIAAAAAGAGLTGGAGSALAVGAGTGITVNADDIALDTAVAVRKYAVDIGNGSATSFTVTHSLSTRDVTVSVYATATPWDEIEVDVAHTSTSTVTVAFTGLVPTTNQYRVVVHG